MFRLIAFASWLVAKLTSRSWSDLSHRSDAIPRPEYPRPQMVRERWLNLNGRWEFEIDNGRSGRDRKLHEAKRLNGCIVVPFCPESKLPGVERKDF